MIKPKEEISIFELASQIQARIGTYYPQTFHSWSKDRFHEFEEKEIGTQAQLREHRRCYEVHLRKDYNEYAEALRAQIAKEYEYFKAALAKEFFGDTKNPLFQEVTDKVFSKAYENGHASGLRDVAYEYQELAELISLCNKLNNFGKFVFHNYVEYTSAI